MVYIKLFVITFFVWERVWFHYHIHKGCSKWAGPSHTHTLPHAYKLAIRYAAFSCPRVFYERECPSDILHQSFLPL